MMRHQPVARRNDVTPRPLLKDSICPTCGLVADGLRCPRCNTLKITGCSGACSACRSKGGCSAG